MKLPRGRTKASSVFAPHVAPSARVLLAFGMAFGVAGGLLGALEVAGVALAIALSQQQIVSYTAQYTAYQQCLRENPTPALCQAPTAGVLTVSAIWLLFLGASLLTFALAQVAYASAARAVARRTGSRGMGVCAAMLAACVGWALYLVASVGSVFLQASPFTMTAPPPGVDTAALHLGTAIGSALFDALTLLPSVLVAMLAGGVAARRALRAPHRAHVSLPPTNAAIPGARPVSRSPSPAPLMLPLDALSHMPPLRTGNQVTEADRKAKRVEPVPTEHEVGV
jgi:hypothetical protein